MSSTTPRIRLSAVGLSLARSAHAAGDVPVVIARASDYFGPETADSVVGERFFGPIIAGKTYRAVGDPDAPHSVTYVPDFARAIVDLARHDEAFGGAWHVPNHGPRGCRSHDLVTNAGSVPDSSAVTNAASLDPPLARAGPHVHQASCSYEIG